ncbi:MAG: hypothetical protein NC831_09045 [Candidatus Omnitrophica bacterium]|nr:hypothetical protein [Candidatus Omnitrophota bacterium]
MLNSGETWLLLIVPGLCQFIFPGIWIDFFLIALFYVSFKRKIFPFFFMVFLWSIIYSIITLDSPGKEMLTLGAVWYLLASFEFNTDIARSFLVVAGCCVYVTMKFCITSMGCTWDIPVTISFAAIFTMIHTMICLIIIFVKNNLSRDRLATV